MATEVNETISLTTGSGNFVPPPPEPNHFSIAPILEWYGIEMNEYGDRCFTLIQVWWHKIGNIFSAGLTILGLTIGLRVIRPRKKGKGTWRTL